MSGPRRARGKFVRQPDGMKFAGAQWYATLGTGIGLPSPYVQVQRASTIVATAMAAVRPQLGAGGRRGRR
jgi:hypothetical protein